MDDRSNIWTLIVNGEKKPWPDDNYLDSPITIDLNWGIDTNIYESKPVTFNVKEVIGGREVKGIKIDEDRKYIICEIPIKEKSKDIKVIIDWSELKASVKTELQTIIEGKPMPIENGVIHLTGKDITSPIKFYYKGIECVSQKEHDVDIIRVNIPYASYQINEKTNRTNNAIYRRWRIISSISLFVGLFIGFIIGITISYSNKREEITEPIVSHNESKTLLIQEENESSRVEIDDKKSQIIEVHNTEIEDVLDKDIWYYDEFEQIPELQGLFNKLRYFKLEEIEKQLQRYKNIPNVRQLLTAIEKCTGHLNGRIVESRYSHEKDSRITVRLYIRRLEQLYINSNVKKSNKIINEFE